MAHKVLWGTLSSQGKILSQRVAKFPESPVSTKKNYFSISGKLVRESLCLWACVPIHEHFY